MDGSCRRQKAKQRQEKLMKEFASKQKRFMEKVVGASGTACSCCLGENGFQILTVKNYTAIESLAVFYITCSFFCLSL